MLGFRDCSLSPLSLSLSVLLPWGEGVTEVLGEESSQASPCCDQLPYPAEFSHGVCPASTSALSECDITLKARFPEAGVPASCHMNSRLLKIFALSVDVKIRWDRLVV